MPRFLVSFPCEFTDSYPTHQLMLSKASDQYDRSGRSRGEATMEYASYQQAKIAINKFDGAMTKGASFHLHQYLSSLTPLFRPDDLHSAAPANNGQRPT